MNNRLAALAMSCAVAACATPTVAAKAGEMAARDRQTEMAAIHKACEAALGKLQRVIPGDLENSTDVHFACLEDGRRGEALRTLAHVKLNCEGTDANVVANTSARVRAFLVRCTDLDKTMGMSGLGEFDSTVGGTTEGTNGLDELIDAEESVILHSPGHK